LVRVGGSVEAVGIMRLRFRWIVEAVEAIWCGRLFDSWVRCLVIWSDVVMDVDIVFCLRRCDLELERLDAKKVTSTSTPI
jgi:hypothetical protein